MPPEPAPEQHGRKYRSKKQRPCDLCRSRKTHCKLLGSEATCELCKKLERRCTFVDVPTRRTLNLLPGRRTNYPQPDAHIISRPTDVGLDRGHAPLPIPSHGDGNRPTVGDAPFWPLRPVRDQTFGLEAAAQSVPMDWTAIAFPSLDMTIENIHSDHRAESILNTPSRGGDLMRPGAANSPLAITSVSPSHSGGAEFESPAMSSGSRHFGDNSSQDCAQNSIDNLMPDSRIQSSGIVSDWPVEFSLDSKQGYSNQILGLSHETDPYLLRNYFYDASDTHPMFRLNYRKVHEDANLAPFLEAPPDGLPRPPGWDMPVQFVMSNEDIWKDSLGSVERILSGNATEKADKELLQRLVPAEVGSRLLKLYMRFVHPRFPVLSLQNISRIPTSHCDATNPIGIESAIYALATPFTFLDDELSIKKGYVQVPTDDLWSIAHRSYQRSTCLSHLSSLQLCLLLLQMPPANYAVAEPLSTWSLSCSAVAIAENLGLNLDPSNWRLPREEIMLRRRLWWLMYTQHVWQAVVISRPSHIHDDNWEVSEITANDFEADELQDEEIRALVLQQNPLCLAEIQLATILADVLKEFYTLKGVRGCATLGTLLSRAQPLRTRIESWRQSVPLLSKQISDLTNEDLEAGAALRLSHLTLETLIFRALLRPLFYQAISATEANQEPISTIFDNCYTCAKVGMELVNSFQAKHFSNFWAPYVRYQLCYFSSFILMNLVQSPSKKSAKRNRILLNRWKDTLRVQSRAWPLAKLATIRLDATFWKGLSLVAHGSGPDSPATMLFGEEVRTPQRET